MTYLGACHLIKSSSVADSVSGSPGSVTGTFVALTRYAADEQVSGWISQSDTLSYSRSETLSYSQSGTVSNNLIFIPHRIWVMERIAVRRTVHQTPSVSCSVTLTTSISQQLSVWVCRLHDTDDTNNVNCPSLLLPLPSPPTHPHFLLPSLSPHSLSLPPSLYPTLLSPHLS